MNEYEWDDIDSYLGVAVELGGEMSVVKEELEAFLRVVVAEIRERRSAGWSASVRILEARSVDGHDRCDGVRRR